MKTKTKQENGEAQTFAELDGIAAPKKKKKKPRNKFVRNGGGPMLDTYQLAEALDESEFAIRNWRRAGKIPCVKLGYRTFRFKLTDVLAALEKRQIREV